MMRGKYFWSNEQAVYVERGENAVPFRGCYCVDLGYSKDNHGMRYDMFSVSGGAWMGCTLKDLPVNFQMALLLLEVE